MDNDELIANISQRCTYLEAVNDVLTKQNNDLKAKLDEHLQRIEVLLGAPCTDHDYTLESKEKDFAPQRLRFEIDLIDGYAIKKTYICKYCGEENVEWEGIKDEEE